MRSSNSSRRDSSPDTFKDTMRRLRHAKIVATLGPASADLATIRALFDAGADVFRLNFSHGTHTQHQERLELIRRVESETSRPIGVLLDLQGPKLRVGSFAAGPLRPEAGGAPPPRRPHPPGGGPPVPPRPRSRAGRRAAREPAASGDLRRAETRHRPADR